MRLEHLDRRVLGAARIVDATTGRPVAGPVTVESAARLLRNRSGHIIIVNAPGLAEHAASFSAPPSTPPLGSEAIELTLRDPSRRYLARRRTIQLPRDPDPAHADQANSLFRVIDVPLYPAPAAPPAAGWALIRATVTRTGSSEGLPGALIRVTRTSDGEHLASGLSDDRGEALVAVAGIPITTWDAGTESVLVSETDVTLQTIVDPAVSGLPDPDDLEARRGSLPSSTTAAQLASGRTLVIALSVSVP